MKWFSQKYILVMANCLWIYSISQKSLIFLTFFSCSRIWQHCWCQLEKSLETFKCFGRCEQARRGNRAMSDVQGVGLYTELNYKWAKNVSKQANKDIPKLKIVISIFRIQFFHILISKQINGATSILILRIVSKIWFTEEYGPLFNLLHT